MLPVPALTAQQQIVMSWVFAAKTISDFAMDTKLAERNDAVASYKFFFALSYPALKPKAGDYWEKKFKETNFERITPLDLYFTFIDYCSDLIREKVLRVDIPPRTLEVASGELKGVDFGGVKGRLPAR